MTLSEPDANFDERFNAIVLEVFDKTPVPGPDVDLVDTEALDSFDLLRLFMAFEDEFGAMWPMEQMTGFRDLSTLAGLREAVLVHLWRP